MGLRFEDHGNKRYAYWCTSRNVPGKDLPVSAKMYIGTLADDGRTIIPKSIDSESFEGPIIDGCFRIRNYGGPLLASKIAEQLGIVDDLVERLDDDAFPVLAASYFYAIHPSKSDLPPAIDTLFLDGILYGKVPTPGKAMKALKDLPHILGAYADSVGASNRCIVFPIGSGDPPTGSAEPVPLFPMTFMVATDEGDPLMVGTIAGCSDNIDACILFGESSSAYGDSPIFYADRLLGDPASSFYRLVRNGKNVIARLDGDRDSFKQTTRIIQGSRSSCHPDQEGDSIAATVDVGLYADKGDVRVVNGFDDRGIIKAKAISIVDHEDLTCDRDVLMKMLKTRRKWLESHVGEIDDLWRWDRRFFDVTADECGQTIVKPKRNVVEKLEDDVYGSAFLTNSPDVGDCTRISRIVNDLRKHAGMMLPMDDHGRIDEGDLWQIIPRIIAMRIRIEISRILETGCTGMNVDDAFRVVSDYRVVTTGDRTLTGSYTNDVRKLFGEFHIDETIIATQFFDYDGRIT